MTTDLLYTVLRYGSLALIWLLISSAILFMNRDIRLSANLGKYRSARQGRKNQGTAARGKVQSASKAPSYLAFIAGPIQNKRLPLRISPIVIGRAPDCTVPLQNNYASAHHLRLYKRDNQWFVEDLNSTNGTLLNGAKLQAATPLKIGDRIQIGQTIMELTR